LIIAIESVSGFLSSFFERNPPFIPLDK